MEWISVRASRSTCAISYLITKQIHKRTGTVLFDPEHAVLTLHTLLALFAFLLCALLILPELACLDMYTFRSVFAGGEKV